ncbi:hypothetical protein [Phenylobacterium sp.]|uniref:hypothetical protein n=1 Tax=Phenylobacterium sp. TaxID=1871053 RepID=UPI003BACA5B0
MSAGLSMQELSSWLGVRSDTVQDWCSGRRPVPKGVFEQLGDLVAKQSSEACRLGPELRGDLDTAVRLLLHSDVDAQRNGWPTAAAFNLSVMRGWSLHRAS